MRLLVWIGLLCLEMGLIVGFYVVPQFQARNAPVGHWEMERPDGPGLWVAVIALLGLFTLGNIGLVVVIWGRFKDLRVNDQDHIELGN